MDDDDKVRRNLVVFSGAILLVAWLHVPLSAVVDRVGGGSSWSVDPFRTWLAAGGILGYLAVRFYFSGGGRGALRTMAGTYRQQVAHAIDRVMVAEAKVQRFHNWWDPPLNAVLKEMIAKYEKAGHPPVLKPALSLLRESGPYGQGDWKFEGAADFRAHWNSEDQPLSVMHQQIQAVKYSLPRWQRILVAGRAFWFSWIFSEEAVGLMAPVWLCLVATCVVAYKLTAALFAAPSV